MQKNIELTEASNPSEVRLTPGGSVADKWRGTRRYDVVRCIGQGEMGVVYEAFDRQRRQRVALKTLLNFSAATLYLFKQEFRSLADVQHPNLVRMYELVATDTDRIFFTMELVRGTDFSSHVRKAGTRQPDFDVLRRTLLQLAQGIHAVHGAGKLHLDIKPSNVRVTAEGRVVLLDFGLAMEFARAADGAMITEGPLMGTVSYAAPEQATDVSPTPPSDWYAFGALLYEALVGRLPFLGSTIEVMNQKNTLDPRRPCDCVDGVPADLDSLCMQLLQRDPAMRPSGAEVLHRLGVTPGLQSPGPRIADPFGANFVGREAQLRALREAFEETRQGRSITVRIAGESGMGKSSLALHFLDELVQGGAAVAFRGRAYDRESVPYKAVDGVVDAISRHLVRLYDCNESVVLPADLWALARLFPVLRRAPQVGAAPLDAAQAPQLVRSRAFVAFRELVSSLARREPLVVFVDDVQWGDIDSVALLLELVRQPQPPPMLLLMTYRVDEAHASAFLTEMRARWPSEAEVRDVAVAPLEAVEAQRLAMTLLASNTEAAQRIARAIGRESRGSPFLVEEFARSVAMDGIAAEEGNTMSAVAITLDEMIRRRLERLPEDARRLAEVVAVGGRPLPVTIAGDAARLYDGVDSTIVELRAHRFVRTGLRDGRETVEMIHDRIRETIVAQLSASAVREQHSRLAQALESTPDADAEALTVHLLGAGDKERAALHAERAAEQAVSKLAFDQAARLFRLRLETIPAASPDARRLRIRLGEVLEWAGHGAEAARAYQEAAEGAPALERAELERAASVELLASGHIDQGAAVLHRVLAAVGLKAPRSPLGALVSLVLYSVWLRGMGVRLKERGPDDVQREDRARIEALFAASLGFAVVDVILGSCMSVRHLIAGLRSGDRFQVLRATILEVSRLSAAGGRAGKFEQRLLDIATRLSDKEENVEGRAFFDGSLGVSLYLRGRWRDALARLDAALSKSRSHSHSAGWQSNGQVFSCWALNLLGEHAELARRHARFLADAERRGDMYTSVQLRDGSLAIVWLAADNPDAARRNAQESIAQWSHTRYLLQHWHMMFGEAEIELYVGDGARAYARVQRDAGALKKSLLLNVQHMRAQTAFVRGRSAIASLDAEPALRTERLAETRRLARQLEGERMAWTAPFAAILSAGAANAEGDRVGAAAYLRAAIELAEAANMSGYATAARYQLGSLLGGDEGRQLALRAEEAMTAQGIRVATRFAGTLVPGRWRVS